MDNKQYIYVGTYSLPIKFGTGEIFNGKGKGIYLYEFDTETANLKLINVTEGVDNPSFLAVNYEAKRLYAVNELKEYKGEVSGSVSSFIIKEDGSLELINRRATHGTDPCHVILSPDRRHLIVSNYMSGSVSVYPVLSDGALGEIEQFIQYEGKGANLSRQAGPHAHSAVFSKDFKFVYICDLGTDSVKAYRYSDSGKPLSDESMTDYSAAPGSGPRFAEFIADGRYAYVINELESSISVTVYDNKTGTLKEIQKVATIPEGSDNKNNICADLHITPDGKFLYGSNRGLDNIAIYSIDKTTGMLSIIGFEPCGGRTPRNFTIDATGRFLLCGNQDSDCIAVFSIDKETGMLKKETEAYAPTPVCVRPAVRAV